MFFLQVTIILLTLGAIAVGRIPGLRINRAGLAWTGAVALIVAGGISPDQAFAHIEMNTLTLLLSLMVLNDVLSEAGFFRLVTSQVVRRAASPRLLLFLIILSSGVLSALFLNDTVVLMLTPLVIDVALTLHRRPIPYLMGLATAANIGSSCTITGNPQNMLIGMSSGISYGEFLATLIVPAGCGLLIAYQVIVVLYREEFADRRFSSRPSMDISMNAAGMKWPLLVSFFMLIGFLLRLNMAVTALAAGGLLLFSRRHATESIFARLDWSLPVFFAGLFVLTRGIELTGLSKHFFDLVLPMAHQGTAWFSVAGALLSNLVSNVPAVMLFRPLIPGFPDPEGTWLVLAMSSTMAGNLTLLGSVANLIVAESARTRGVHLTFREYLKAGVPITILTTASGTAWLYWF